MHANRPANDNSNGTSGGETVCDGHVLTALVNATAALEQLIPHAHQAPVNVQSFASASLHQAEQAIKRMGVVHVG